jgi:NADH dehydrogenase FAD-containing subunit
MRILILGGGYAGVLAALRLANRGLGHQVTLVNAEPEFVERIRHHELGAATPPPRRPLADLLRKTQLTLVIGRVAELDLERQVAVLADGRPLPWDRLVFALGSTSDDGGVRGVREHALLLGNEAGGFELRARLAAGARRLVVVGGGLTGVELAAELAEKVGKTGEVTLLAPGGVGSFLSPEAQAYLRKQLLTLGVTIGDQKVSQVQAGEVVLASGERLPCDACVWAGGFRAPSLAGAGGLAVNPLGQIVVDERLRSRSHPNVYAVGDAADTDFDAGSPILMGCKYAMPMGIHAAENLARAARGEKERPFRFGDTGFCISLGRNDGLVQINHTDGSPRRIVTGRLAAWIKERICRYTVWSVRLERHFAFYRWMRPPRRALPADDRRQLAA